MSTLRIYQEPRRGHCACCEFELTTRPVYRHDEAYCCLGCAGGGPCVCTYEADLADDGVDGIGMPFAVPARTRAAEPEAPVRG